jgi:hypothetical protein
VYHEFDTHVSVFVLWNILFYRIFCFVEECRRIGYSERNEETNFLRYAGANRVGRKAQKVRQNRENREIDLNIV